MNSIEITKLLSTNAYTKDNFLGCFPVDQLPCVDGKTKFSLIVNLDVSTGPGTHWCAIYKKNKKVYYFDSFGRPPPSKYLRFWFKRFVKSVFFNKIRHQEYDSSRCGGYCCWLIHEMSRGKSFSSLVRFLDSIDFDEQFIHTFMKKNFNHNID